MIQRRAPLKRTPLKRAGVREPSDACTFRMVKAKRAKPRRVSVDRNPEYRRFLREFGACVVCVKLEQEGTPREGWEYSLIDPAHTKNNGMRSKGPDSSCAPLCRFHHISFDAGRATFEEKHEIDMTEQAAIWWKLFKGEGK